MCRINVNDVEYFVLIELILDFVVQVFQLVLELFSRSCRSDGRRAGIVLCTIFSFILIKKFS